MKLPLRQLSRHLSQGLAPIYLAAADEPLLVAEATDAVRAAARSAGFDERELHFVERGFRWDALESSADSLSLFASRRIVELRMASPRPGEAGARAIRALAERNDSDCLVIIAIAARLDASAARSVWVKTIEKHGVVVDIWPVDRAELPRWIGERSARLGLRLTEDAVSLLADRVEGNLLAADQELNKLALTAPSATIDESAVLEAVAESARFDVFKLSDAILAGDLARAVTVLAALRAEGVQPPLIAWAVGRELSLLARLAHAVRSGERIEQAMGRQHVWRRREPLVRRAVARYDWDDLAALLRLAARADRAIKGLERTPPWEALTELVLATADPKAWRPAA